MNPTPKLYLVRHGDAAPPGTLAGQADFPLSALGEAQIFELRQQLAGIAFSAAWSSPLVRARRTAQIILAGNAANIGEASVVSDLREISLGLWDGRSKAWIKRHFPEEWAARGKNLLHCPPPGGESFSALAARVLPAFAAVAAQAALHRHSLLAAHQAVNRVILASVAGLLPERLFDIPQPPAALSVLEITGKGVRLPAGLAQR